MNGVGERSGTNRMRGRIAGRIAASAAAVVCLAAGYVAGASGLFLTLNEIIASKLNTEAAPVWKIARAERLIERHFVDPADGSKLADAAIEGMLQSLGDDYANYYTAEEFRERMSHLHSELVGIGVVVEKTAEGAFVIQTVYPDTPAASAGIRPHDRIVSVDDRPVGGLGLEELVDLVRGPKGSVVRLRLERPGQTEPIDVSVRRAVIQVPNTEHRMLDQERGVGYIRLYGFTGHATENVRKAIEELNALGMKRLIFDLRYNGGGLLDEAIGVSSLFVPKGKPIMHLEYRNRPRQTLWSRAESDRPFGKPLVVLVNGSTASASEVFSGAIRDLKLGRLVGTKTFGKGISQTWYELGDGSGFQMTTARYQTAGGFSIHGTGIVPDVTVENDSPNVLPGEPGDRQLEVAIREVLNMPADAGGSADNPASGP